jgi:hypothetical protein
MRCVNAQVGLGLQRELASVDLTSSQLGFLTHQITQTRENTEQTQLNKIYFEQTTLNKHQVQTTSLCGSVQWTLVLCIATTT